MSPCVCFCVCVCASLIICYEISKDRVSLRFTSSSINMGPNRWVCNIIDAHMSLDTLMNGEMWYILGCSLGSSDLFHKKLHYYFNQIIILKCHSILKQGIYLNIIEKLTLIRKIFSKEQNNLEFYEWSQSLKISEERAWQIKSRLTKISVFSLDYLASFIFNCF